MPEVAIGIDTSCYTTSLALAGEGVVVLSKRKLLSVPRGERGLRQSDGVFQHVRNLPELYEELMDEADAKIACVCVSRAPRDVPGSYMPVFAAGTAFARVIARTLGVPLFFTTHQQGHVAAALYESGLNDDSFVAMHLSGGTTEALRVEKGLKVSLLGGSNDLHAGQLVDRIGVKLGLPFPAGPELEKLAVNGSERSLVGVSVKGLSASLSGAENAINRLIDGGAAPEDAAVETYSFLARTIARLAVNACDASGLKKVLMMGGVASSPLFRREVSRRIKKLRDETEIYWGKKELSGDNACGVALIGDRLLKEGT
ncbi:MAG: O-sialoglycoprotein endopeptidase [Clostridia bacterium]|nr:O-sialoglycoprotein endopeptidase [Clostridia bacterium]